MYRFLNNPAKLGSVRRQYGSVDTGQGKDISVGKSSSQLCAGVLAHSLKLLCLSSPW